MKTTYRLPTPPLSKETISDAMERATAHLCRAAYQFEIPGPRREDHWTRALDHLYVARGAFEEAVGVLEAMLVTLYGPREGGP